MKNKRKPPKGKPFVKGDPRINRAGIAKVKVEVREELRKAFLAKGAEPYPNDPTGKTSNFEAINNRLFQLATAGESWAVTMIFERCYGKVTQPVTDGEGGALRCLVIKETELSDGLRSTDRTGS